MKYFYRLSLKKFLIMFTLIFTIVPCTIVTIYSYFYTKSSIENVCSVDYLRTAFYELEENSNILTSYINTLITDISNNNIIYDKLLDNNISYEDKQAFIDNYFTSLIDKTPNIEGIEIINDNYISYRATRSKTILPQASREYIDKLTLYKLTINNSGSNAVCFGKKIYNYKKSHDLGYIIIYLNNNVFKPFDLKNNFGTFFITSNNMILYHPDESYINSHLYLYDNNVIDMNTHHRLTNQKLATYKIGTNEVNDDLTVNCTINHNASMNSLKSLLLKTFYLLLATVIMSVFIALFKSSRLLQHIIYLNQNIKNFANNKESQNIMQSYNEVHNLEMNFNNMILRINNLVTEVNNEKEKQKNLAINTLQSQINPHFLYNVLDIISWEAKKENQPLIDEMICSLAIYLRLGLHSGKTIVSVDSECEHVRKYVELEKYRFPDLFDIEFNIEDSIKKLGVPKIILQPIVENSIRHGFKKIDYKGLINITGFLSAKNDIIFIIKDNGIGCDIDINNTIPQSQKEFGGVGLNNINERLKSYCGEDYSLQIESSKGKGFTVTLKIKPQPM